MQWEKLFFLFVYKCRRCGCRNRVSYLGGKVFHLHAQCPRCGSTAPARRVKADRIDTIVRSPYRLLHQILGGVLYHCSYCRLQFHDIRSLTPKPEAAVESESQPSTATTVS